MKTCTLLQRWFLLITMICVFACSSVSTENQSSNSLEQAKPAIERSKQKPSLDLGPDSDFAVVFLHGWLMDTNLWSYHAEDFRGNYRCYVYAQPGHNASGFNSPVTMTRWAEMLQKELETAGITRAVLVGHSMGGMLALELTRKRPALVAGLVLVATTDAPGNEASIASVSSQLENWDEKTANEWASLLVGKAYLQKNPTWQKSFYEQVYGYDREWLTLLWSAIEVRRDQRAFTPTISVPTVVVHSRSDAAIPFSAAEELAQRIPGASLLEIDSGGHALPIERPKEVSEAIRLVLSDVHSHTSQEPPTNVESKAGLDAQLAK